MNCHQARIYLSPYLDSELDPTTTYEVARHLQSCGACTQQFAAEQTLEHTIQDQLRRAPEDAEELIERALSQTLTRQRWGFGGRALGAAIALLLSLGFLSYRLASRPGHPVPELLAMAAQDHRGYLMGEITPELLTRDPQAMALFFEGQLAAEMGPLPRGSGWELEGARVCHFHDQPIGFVTLRYHGIPVSVVDLPQNGVRAVDKNCFELEGGRGIMRPTASGVRVAFGDVGMARLEEVVRAAR